MALLDQPRPPLPPTVPLTNALGGRSSSRHGFDRQPTCRNRLEIRPSFSPCPQVTTFDLSESRILAESSLYNHVVVAYRGQRRSRCSSVAGDLLVVHINLSDRREVLALDHRRGFELELLAVRECDRYEPLLDRVETVLGSDCVGHRLDPLFADVGGLLDPNVLDPQRPAYPEVPRPFVSTVVAREQTLAFLGLSVSLIACLSNRDTKVGKGEHSGEECGRLARSAAIEPTDQQGPPSV